MQKIRTGERKGGRRRKGGQGNAKNMGILVDYCRRSELEIQTYRGGGKGSLDIVRTEVERGVKRHRGRGVDYDAFGLVLRQE